MCVSLVEAFILVGWCDAAVTIVASRCNGKAFTQGRVPGKTRAFA